MSVAFADYDHDGRLDMFVPNDTVPNFLFHNKGDGTFDRNGAPRRASRCPTPDAPISSMGTDFQDYDNDGWEDIHVTALAGETFPLFQQRRPRRRSSRRRKRAGSRPPTVKSSGWCSVFADVDNDGWKDIFTANSHVNDRIGDFAGDPVEAAEQPVHQRRTGYSDNGFRDATAEAGLRGRRRRPPGMRRRRLRRRRPSRLRRPGRSADRRSCGRTTARRPSLADRPADRHEEQPRRHRRAGQGRQSGADDDDVDRLRLVVTCRTALRSGNDGGARDGRSAMALRHQADGREACKTNQVVEIKEK